MYLRILLPLLERERYGLEKDGDINGRGGKGRDSTIKLFVIKTLHFALETTGFIFLASIVIS